MAALLSEDPKWALNHKLSIQSKQRIPIGSSLAFSHDRVMLGLQAEKSLSTHMEAGVLTEVELSPEKTSQRWTAPPPTLPAGWPNPWSKPNCAGEFWCRWGCSHVHFRSDPTTPQGYSCMEILPVPLSQVSYAIGVAQPLSISVFTYGSSKKTESELLQIVNKNFDLRPGVIVR